ncbi:MAG: FHA domain-containing protein, partial [bacterium]
MTTGTQVVEMANNAAGSEATDDVVIRLRQWGTDKIHVLPELPFGRWLVGNSSDCAVRLVDRFVAPKHAELRLEANGWWIFDRGTPQGVRQDGVPRRRFPLTPGVEIGIGATTLVAESLRCVRLREFCQRLLGWGGDRTRAVDQALRTIRAATARRAALVLCGDGDLVPIAYALHRYTQGDAAPFIVCDRRRRDTNATVRARTNIPTGMEAFTAATGGSLCLRWPRLPADIDEVVGRAYEPESEVQLVMCVRRQHRAVALSGTMTIQMPPLQIREIELPRIVEEYAADAIKALGAR